jgi:hypothetical protein
MPIETLTDINDREFTNVAYYDDSDDNVFKIGDSTEIDGGLRVSGDITAFATLTWSDAKLKDDVEPLQDCLAKINQMQGVSYTFKPSGKKQVGLIAQEVLDIIPEVVELENDYYSVSYPNLVAVLIEAVKELSSRVEDLENK